ncbi:MAG: glycosyltransferase WbuB [Nitrospirales bacterium]|nr:MAG: glycosyltransferase WbuB [Nitrospirales bacterium]
MMRVHIISDVFPPEPVTAAGTARDIAEELSSRGHDVSVFAPFPNRPMGKLMEGYKRSWKKIEYRNGYRVIYSWHTLSKNSTLLSRTIENITFGITSTIQLMREPLPDVVYMNTWPIFAQWLNTFTLAWRKVPVICVVHDLYPETYAGTGRMSKDKRLFRIVRAIDASVYHHCALVTTLNPVQEKVVLSTRNVSKNKLLVFNDWVDATRFPQNTSKNGEFRKKHGFAANLFLAMYVGSLTRMAGLELYVNAAERLRHRQDILILLVGDGAMREKVEGLIKEKGLKNIQIIYPLKPEMVPEVQAASDTLMLSLLPEVGDDTTPSKLVYYMFSTRPVIASVKKNGPPAQIINEAACGHVIPQGSYQDLADKLEEFADHPTHLSELGENARRYAEEHFLKENVLPRICNVIENVSIRKFSYVVDPE